MGDRKENWKGSGRDQEYTGIQKEPVPGTPTSIFLQEKLMPLVAGLDLGQDLDILEEHSLELPKEL